jgi:AGCS family alanine or glycine:cation symporter
MRDYDSQVRAGVEEPVFDPRQYADLDIDPAAWPAVDATVSQPAPASAVPARS